MMKAILPMTLFIIVLLGLVLNTSTIYRISNANENYYERGTDDDDSVELTRIRDNIWIHTTYYDYNGTRTPSNGVLAVTSDGIVMIDTPWNDKQTDELLKLAEDVFNEEVKLAIITHAHQDRIGGIGALLENSVDVRSTEKTMKEAEKMGFLMPQPLLDMESAFTFGGVQVEVFYPGEGHTTDNSIVWFQQDKVLFGGCLIKSLDTTSKGNVEHANIKEWPNSVLNVMDRYADAVTVVPGHGSFGNSDLLGKTWELVSQ